MEIYPEFLLSDEELRAFVKDRKGFVAGRKLITKFKWKIGDTVTLKGLIFPGDWDFVLRGVYRGRDKTVDETQFLFHWDYLNERIKPKMPTWANQVGFYMIGLTRPELAADVSIAVDKTFKNSLAETLTETEKAFQMSFVSMTETIVSAIQLVSFVVIIIIMAVVANTMAMTTRERIGEYAILKTMGFGGWHILSLILGESLVITLVGGVLGIVLTFPAAAVFSHELSNFFPIFNVETKTIYLDFAAALLVGIIAAVVPTRLAIRIRIADGLRRIG
jgi:putative ABC transport system permease protein